MKIFYHPELGELELNRKKGRKNISLQYKYAEGKFRVSFPYNCPVNVAIKFANDKLEWMKKTKSKSSGKIIARNLGKVNRKIALETFTNLAKEICNTTGMNYKEIKIRKMKSLWGSCSHDNRICLNEYLANLPLNIQYYVVLHELCHTIVKDHSKKFWELVSYYWKDSLLLDKELKKYVP
jgi:predicted metal-dependent hydrolase